MNLKFAANLNFLFLENSSSLVERILLAHKAGFRAVEIPFPKGDINDVIKAKEETGIEVALINIALGESEDHKFGLACIPGAQQKFKELLSQTTCLAKILKCKKIHIMAGTTGGPATADHMKIYEENLRYAADWLAKEDLQGVIEPINKYSVPNYFMNSYDIAYPLLKRISSDRLKLMVDVFHLQLIRGNISHTLEEVSDVIGHVQIAQVPHRHEPDIDGEINYPYVFSLLDNMGYKDWIGCEYKPKTTTVEGLQWISKYGLKL